MTVDTTQAFHLTGVRWRTQKSREIRGDRMPAVEVPVAVSSALVVCTKCSESWRGYEGTQPGQIRTAMGMLHITCPRCGADGEVPTAGLQ